MADPVLAGLHASAARRAVGLALLVAVGAALVWSALARPPGAPGWRLFVLGAYSCSAPVRWRSGSPSGCAARRGRGWS
jgi:hypothetical protein